MTAVDISALRERVAGLEAGHKHLASKGDLYRGLLLLLVAQTTVTAAMLSIAVRVLD